MHYTTYYSSRLGAWVQGSWVYGSPHVPTSLFTHPHRWPRPRTHTHTHTQREREGYTQTDTHTYILTQHTHKHIHTPMVGQANAVAKANGDRRRFLAAKVDNFSVVGAADANPNPNPNPNPNTNTNPNPNTNPNTNPNPTRWMRLMLTPTLVLETFLPVCGPG